MRDWQKETEQRVEWIKNIVSESHAKGIIFGNSGGKDSALVGILCKMACPNTLGVIMPCQSNRNYTIDKVDGENLAQKFGIECDVVDVTPIKQAMMSVLPVASSVIAAVSNCSSFCSFATESIVSPSDSGFNSSNKSPFAFK